MKIGIVGKSRYIDANKLIERLMHNSDFLTAPKHSKDGIIDEIVYQPTADVVEVRHGEWKQSFYPYYVYCSECEREAPTHGGYYSTPCYCPHCGAKMDGERRKECSSN